MLKGNISCTIVNKLITYFVEDNLDDKCKNMVTTHLRNCPICMERYAIVKKLYLEAERKRKLIKENEIMQEEISAYLDGEMSYDKIRDFERKLSQKPQYEDNLIKTMRLKKLLNNSFYKTKYNLKTNLTEKIMKEIQNKEGIKQKIENFFKNLFQ